MRPAIMTIEDHIDFAKRINAAKQDLIDLFNQYGSKFWARESDLVEKCIKPIDNVIFEFSEKMHREHKEALRNLRTNHPEIINAEWIYYP